MRRQLLTLFAALGLAAALVAGLAHLFALRFEHGDVYPAYSTLRADPLGAKALYESLGALPGVETRRNYRPLPRLRTAGPVTLFYAGVTPDSAWGDEELRVFEALVAAGSRAVFTFPPAATGSAAPWKEKPPEAKKKAPDEKPDPAKKPEAKDGSPDEKPDGKTPDAEEGSRHTVRFREVARRWGFDLDVTKAPRGKLFLHPALATAEAGALEPELTWHSVFHFTELAPAWRTLYACEGKPVLVERAWGAGTLVLAADSFFLSDEALRTELRPRLLAWLAGAPRTLIFDEEHHGVTEQSDFTTLIRKYRLHGAVAALGLVAALFIWKHTACFVPPHRTEDESARGDLVGGRDSTEGFTNLLRRTIPPARILETCVEEWRRSVAHQPRELDRVETALAAEQAKPARARDGAAAYRAIRRVLFPPKPARLPVAKPLTPNLR